MQIQKKTHDVKHVLFKTSGVLLMLMGFVAGIVLAIFLLLPLLKALGPDPNKIVVIFVVLPAVVVIASMVGYAGIFLVMSFGKPFLSPAEARKYIFESRTPDHEIPRAVNLIFIKPYYKMANLIYPQAGKQTNGQ